MKMIRMWLNSTSRWRHFTDEDEDDDDVKWNYFGGCVSLNLIQILFFYCEYFTSKTLKNKNISLSASQDERTSAANSVIYQHTDNYFSVKAQQICSNLNWASPEQLFPVTWAGGRQGAAGGGASHRQGNRKWELNVVVWI